MRFPLPPSDPAARPCTGHDRALLALRTLAPWLLIGMLWGSSGCAILWPHQTAHELDTDRRAARIRVLRDAIDHDHSRLEALITDPGPGAKDALRADPEIGRIAARLELYQRELGELGELEDTP